MNLRTPPPRKRRSAVSALPPAEKDHQFWNIRSPNTNYNNNNSNSSNNQMITCEDSPVPESSYDHPITSDHMLCAYQCRQMVLYSSFSSSIAAIIWWNVNYWLGKLCVVWEFRELFECSVFKRLTLLTSFYTNCCSWV